MFVALSVREERPELAGEIFVPLHPPIPNELCFTTFHIMSLHFASLNAKAKDHMELSTHVMIQAFPYGEREVTNILSTQTASKPKNQKSPLKLPSNQLRVAPVQSSNRTGPNHRLQLHHHAKTFTSQLPFLQHLAVLPQQQLIFDPPDKSHGIHRVQRSIIQITVDRSPAPICVGYPHTAQVCHAAEVMDLQFRKYTRSVCNVHIEDRKRVGEEENQEETKTGDQIRVLQVGEVPRTVATTSQMKKGGRGISFFYFFRFLLVRYLVQ